MPRTKLCEVVLPTDRWSARAVSPVNIRNGVDPARYGKVVVLHPGWGKSPERHTDFLVQLAENGFLPVGVDTRYGYGDRSKSQRNKLLQPRVVSGSNPYFAVNGRAENRWLYRRPTVLLNVCEQLGIVERSYIGHSEGARVSALAASVTSDVTDKLIIVNGAGTGDSSRGASRLARSNVNNARSLLADSVNLPTAAKSAVGSVFYSVTHPRRTWAEKQVIQANDTWSVVDQLEGTDVGVSVFHARDDELIAFSDSQERASARPWVEFTPTDGTHSNIYEKCVRDLIIQSLDAGTA